MDATISTTSAGSWSSGGASGPTSTSARWALIGRLHRLADALNAELRPVFAEAGLGDGDFDVLAALRRSGPPYALTPGELAATTMVTSGAVTKRIDRLEEQAWSPAPCATTTPGHGGSQLTDAGPRAVDDLVREARRQRAPAGVRAHRRASGTQLAHCWRPWGRTLDV